MIALWKNNQHSGLINSSWRYALALICASILSIHDFKPSIKANLVSIKTMGILFSSELRVYDVYAKEFQLRNVRSTGKSNQSLRQDAMFSFLERIREQMSACSMKSVINNSDNDWEKKRLRNPIHLVNGFVLVAVNVLSDNIDYSIGRPIHVALLFENKDKDADLSSRQITNEDEGWLTFVRSEGIVMEGYLNNLVKNAGLEWPTAIMADSRRVHGIVSPEAWGIGGPNAWRSVFLQQTGDLRTNQVICVRGSARLSVPFISMRPGEYVMFGATFSAKLGKGKVEPHLVAFPSRNYLGEPVRTASLSTVHIGSKVSCGYGIMPIDGTWDVSLFMDSWGGQDEEYCFDNLLIAKLPSLHDIRFN